MHSKRWFPSRFVSQILAWAMLFASLAPSMSHAIVALQGNTHLWMPICSTGGSKFVRISLKSPEAGFGYASPIGDSKRVNSQVSEHAPGGCPFCSPGAQALTLPVATALAAPRLGKDIRPFEACRAKDGRSEHRLPMACGPPVSSSL